MKFDQDMVGKITLKANQRNVAGTESPLETLDVVFSFMEAQRDCPG
jgi:hypothetical protein